MNLTGRVPSTPDGKVLLVTSGLADRESLSTFAAVQQPQLSAWGLSVSQSPRGIGDTLRG